MSLLPEAPPGQDRGKAGLRALSEPGLMAGALPSAFLLQPGQHSQLYGSHQQPIVTLQLPTGHFPPCPRVYFGYHKLLPPTDAPDCVQPTAFPWKRPPQPCEKKGGLGPRLRTAGPGHVHRVDAKLEPTPNHFNTGIFRCDASASQVLVC